MVVEVIPAGRRLELVPLEISHAEEMVGVLGDPALHRFTGGAPERVTGRPRATG